MNKLLLISTVILLSWATTSLTDTVVVHEDSPNVGDTTTVTTYNTGTSATTTNLISKTWNDGSWVGTMFPDSSDLNESTYLTGKDGKYAESTWNSENTLTEQEIKQGFTSRFGADIRWWNPVESTVTMSQHAQDNNGNSTTQTLLLEDTTNHNYVFNTYQNTLIVSPQDTLTHGTITTRFDFNIVNDNQAGYNGGHAGVDVTKPSLIIDYTTLTETTTTVVQFCWEKNPTTCPGQDEIEDVNEIIEEIEDIKWEEENYYEANNTPDFNTTSMPGDTFYMDEDIEYGWEDKEVLDYEDKIVLLNDDFFFETEDYQNNYTDYEEPSDINFDEDFELDKPSFETENYFETKAEDYVIDDYNNAPSIEEEMFVEDYNTKEFVDEYDTKEEYIEIIEKPSIVVEAESKEEEVLDEPEPEIEEQPNSEEPIANEPEPKQDTPQQEKIIEEPVKTESEPEPEAEPEATVDENIEEKLEEEPIKVKEKPKVNIKIKVADIEKVLKEKITNEMQRVSVTLDVINEVISRDMISQQPDISSYNNINQAMFDNRQLPSGNMNFFNDHLILASYNKTIYNNQTTLGSLDPVAQHEIKVQEAQQSTLKAYLKFKELLNERNGI